jgi:hypothetical protein
MADMDMCRRSSPATAKTPKPVGAGSIVSSMPRLVGTATSSFSLPSAFFKSPNVANPAHLSSCIWRIVLAFAATATSLTCQQRSEPPACRPCLRRLASAPPRHAPRYPITARPAPSRIDLFLPFPRLSDDVYVDFDSEDVTVRVRVRVSARTRTVWRGVRSWPIPTSVYPTSRA